jgi:hypothetical protein
MQNVGALDSQYLIISSLSKVNKLCIISYNEVIFPNVTYFHTQIKSHNIQILNSEHLINTFNYLLDKKSSLIICEMCVYMYTTIVYRWTSNTLIAPI